MVDTLARMRQLIGTETGWQNNDLVLGDGELALERSGNNIRFKIGNGTSTYSALPFVGLFDDTVKTHNIIDMDDELPTSQTTVAYGVTTNSTLNMPPTTQSTYGNLTVTWLSNATNGGQFLYVRDGEVWSRDYRSGAWEDWKLLSPSITVANTAPATPHEQQLWLDTSGSYPLLKMWDGGGWEDTQTLADHVASPDISNMDDEWPQNNDETTFGIVQGSTLNAPSVGGGISSGGNLAITWRNSNVTGGQMIYYRDGEVWIREFTAGAWEPWKKVGPSVLVGNVAPGSPNTNLLWLDTSGVVPAFKYWDGSAWQLAQTPPDYVNSHNVADLDLELPAQLRHVQWGTITGSTLNAPSVTGVDWGNLVMTWRAGTDAAGQIAFYRNGEIWQRNYWQGAWEGWVVISPSVTVSDNEPTSAYQDQVWLDTSSTFPTLKMWDNGAWVIAHQPTDQTSVPLIADLNDELPDEDNEMRWGMVRQATLNTPPSTDGTINSNLAASWRDGPSAGGQMVVLRGGEIWIRMYASGTWEDWKKASGIPVTITAPSNPNTEDVWLDTSGTFPALKYWDGSAWSLAQTPSELIYAPHITDMDNEFPSFDDAVNWGTIIGTTANVPTTQTSANSIGMTWRNAPNAGGQMIIDRDGAMWTRVYAGGAWESWKQVASSMTISSSPPSGGNNGDIWYQV